MLVKAPEKEGIPPEEVKKPSLVSWIIVALIVTVGLIIYFAIAKKKKKE